MKCTPYTTFLLLEPESSLEEETLCRWNNSSLMIAESGSFHTGLKPVRTLVIRFITTKEDAVNRIVSEKLKNIKSNWIPLSALRRAYKLSVEGKQKSAVKLIKSAFEKAKKTKLKSK